MLSAENSLVLVIDIQEKLVNALEKDTIVSKAKKIVESARILDIPVLFTEQYPKGLGQTVAELLKDKSVEVARQLSSQAARLDNGEISQSQQFDTNLSTVQPFNPSTDNSLSSYHPTFLPSNCVFEKTQFNALLEDGFLEKIKSFGKKQIVIMGIETHICVYQTACALVEAGFEVYAIKDACASRNKYEFKQGIEAMKDNGVKISCVEIALFEWLKGSKHPKFKEIQALIK